MVLLAPIVKPACIAHHPRRSRRLRRPKLFRPQRPRHRAPPALGQVPRRHYLKPAQPRHHAWPRHPNPRQRVKPRNPRRLGSPRLRPRHPAGVADLPLLQVRRSLGTPDACCIATEALCSQIFRVVTNANNQSLMSLLLSVPRSPSCSTPYSAKVRYGYGSSTTCYSVPSRRTVCSRKAVERYMLLLGLASHKQTNPLSQREQESLLFVREASLKESPLIAEW